VIKSRKSWKDALGFCQSQNGATLASLDDKQEEDYVRSIMKSRGLSEFHILTRSSLLLPGFMCEYNLGESSKLILFKDTELSMVDYRQNFMLQVYPKFPYCCQSYMVVMHNQT
jgi:hypothetical protein